MCCISLTDAWPFFSLYEVAKIFLTMNIKTQILGHVDQYTIKIERWSSYVSQWPAVIHSDLVQYHVQPYTTSYMAQQQLCQPVN